jgi:hypothetical protein
MILDSATGRLVSIAEGISRHVSGISDHYDDGNMYNRFSLAIMSSLHGGAQFA